MNDSMTVQVVEGVDELLSDLAYLRLRQVTVIF